MIIGQTYDGPTSGIGSIKDERDRSAQLSRLSAGDLMPWILVAPGAAVLIGVTAGRLQHRVHPAAATVAYTLIALIASVAMIGGVVVTAVTFLAQQRWAPAWYAHAVDVTHTVPVAVGSVSLALVVVVVGSCVRGLPRPHQKVTSTGGGVVVLPFDAAFAYAVPGRPGEVVVSAGMLHALDSEEQRVLFAHERSHLRRHHHRYLGIAGAAAAAVPLVRPLRSRVLFATERWADEDAAAEVGDRRLVARAICRAALAQRSGSPTTGMAIAELGVSRRVDALLDGDGHPGQAPHTVLASATVAVAASGAAPMTQLHHLFNLTVHLLHLG